MNVSLTFGAGGMKATVEMDPAEYAAALEAVPLPPDHDLQGLEHSGSASDILMRLARMILKLEFGKEDPSDIVLVGSPASPFAFTFVIKAFKRKKCLERLIASIREQGFTEPIIVADDSGKVEPPSGLNPDAGDLYLPLPFDVGLSAGRNAAVDRVSTPFFVLLDDDFVFDDRTDVRKLVRTAADLGFDIAAGALDEGGEIRHYEGQLELKDRVLTYREGMTEVAAGVFKSEIVFNFFAARTEAVRLLKWDPELKLAEHTDFFLRAKEAGLRVAYVPEVIVIHRPERPDGYAELRLRGSQFFKQFMRRRGIGKVINFKGDALSIGQSSAGVEAIIKTYERPECVERLLLSIAAHAPGLQVTIGDDSKRFSAKWYRDLWTRAMKAGLKLQPSAINLGHDVGLSAGRNRLIDATRTEYVLVLDDDFVFTRETDLSKLRKILDTNPDIGVVAGGIVNEDGSEYHFEGEFAFDGRNRSLAIRKTESPCYNIEGVDFQRFDIVPNFALFRREVFDSIRWDDRIKINGEHTDFFFRLKNAGRWKVAFVPSCRIIHAQRFPTDYKPDRKRTEFLRLMLDKHSLNELRIFGLSIAADPYNPDGVIRSRVNP